MTAIGVASRKIGGLASATGGAAIVGIVTISLFFIFGGIFGPLNDLCIALEAVLSALLAGRLHPWHHARSPRLSLFALIAAWLGALIAVLGSVLVIFRIRGWYLAGLYTTFGYAFIGLWLLGLSQAAQRSAAWPRRLAQLGKVSGFLMAVGFLAGPGILRGVDAMDAAPWWVNIGLLSGLGWFLLYPLWCLCLGRRFTARGETRPEASPA